MLHSLYGNTSSSMACETVITKYHYTTADQNPGSIIKKTGVHQLYGYKGILLYICSYLIRKYIFAQIK